MSSYTIQFLQTMCRQESINENFDCTKGVTHVARCLLETCRRQMTTISPCTKRLLIRWRGEHGATCETPAVTLTLKRLAANKSVFVNRRCYSQMMTQSDSINIFCPRLPRPVEPYVLFGLLKLHQLPDMLFHKGITYCPLGYIQFPVRETP